MCVCQVLPILRGTNVPTGIVNLNSATLWGIASNFNEENDLMNVINNVLMNI